MAVFFLELANINFLLPFNFCKWLQCSKKLETFVPVVVIIKLWQNVVHGARICAFIQVASCSGRNPSLVRVEAGANGFVHRADVAQPLSHKG